MEKHHPNISVVVPVFNSEKSLAKFYARTSETLESVSTDWEIIFVDDGSTDSSWNELLTLRKNDQSVKIIRLARNHGQQHATLCGIGYAQKDYIITIDDDLQCFPEDIPLFIAELTEGKDVVIGHILAKQHSLWRNICSNINGALAGKVIGKPQHLSLSSYRGFSKKIAQKLIKYKGAHPHIAALLLKLTPPSGICNVRVRHAPRSDGKASTYSLVKLTRAFSYLLINHSLLPLRFMIGWGVTISILSVAFAIWVLVRALMLDAAASGWASLAVLISFLAGNILLSLGIVGEYLGRLVEESSNISQFSIYEEHVS